jgi:hypothetical protein
MLLKQINGYTIEITAAHPRLHSRFITLIDDKGSRHQFNMVKPDGQWVIRNPLTVPPFVLEIEKELAELL